MALFGFFKRGESKQETEGVHPLLRALLEGGETVERAFDVVQGKIGPILRGGGEEAIRAFMDFSSIVSEAGNDDSIKRFITRFVPMLPPEVKAEVMRRYELNAQPKEVDPDEEKAEQLRASLSAGGETMEKAVRAIFERVKPTLKAGGTEAIECFFSVLRSLAKPGGKPAIDEFVRWSFMVLPHDAMDEITTRIKNKEF
jgi:hypothetical protein